MTSSNNAFHYIIILILLVSGSAFAQEHSSAIQAKKLFDIRSGSVHKFQQPSNFAVNKQGNVFILDDLSESILVYDNEGKFQSSFGKHTNEKVGLYKSYCIASDDFDLIHVFDPYENAILIFETNGTLKKSIKINFDDALKHKITELIYSYNNYFLVDNENHYFYIFDTAGHITKRVGKRGEMQEEFRNPFSLAFDIEGRIYITDVLNSRVQVFGTTGTYLNQISDFGFTGGKVFRPNGVAVDSKLNVYISDVYLGVIYVFKSDGTFISPLMSDGQMIKFATPTRLKIRSDKLYVLEMQENAVSVYELTN